jgi:hypothetical protein
LPYFKQGDDLASTIVKNNDKIDAKKSFQNHVDLLLWSVDILTKIKDALPDDADVDIHADTHYICITADKTIIQKLVDDKLVDLCEEDEYDSADEQTDCSADPEDNKQTQFSINFSDDAGQSENIDEVD